MRDTTSRTGRTEASPASDSAPSGATPGRGRTLRAPLSASTETPGGGGPRRLSRPATQRRPQTPLCAADSTSPTPLRRASGQMVFRSLCPPRCDTRPQACTTPKGPGCGVGAPTRGLGASGANEHGTCCQTRLLEHRSSIHAACPVWGRCINTCKLCTTAHRRRSHTFFRTPR